MKERLWIRLVLVTLLLTSMLGLVFDVGVVGAGGTIIIRADGSIDPPTAPISTVDNITYTFTADIYDSISVKRDNIIVDGNGHTLQGAGFGHGFSLSYRSNVTIQNTNIKNFSYGVYLYSSSFNTFSGNNITNNKDYGVWLRDGSFNNTISGNNITNNNDYGIELYKSSNNVLSNNIMAGNGYSFAVFGSTLSHFTQDVDDSNTVDGKPIYYLFNRQDMEVPSDAGYVAFIDSVNITVEGLELKNNGQGILLANTTNSQITNNNITNNFDGVYFYESSNNSIYGNNITNNYDGVRLVGSSNNTVFGNTATSNAYGIMLRAGSDYNTVSGNNASNCTMGIHLSSSSNNTISGNNASNNYFIGIMFDHSCYYNTVSGNNASNNGDYGIHLWGGCLYLRNEYNTISGNNANNNGDCGIHIYEGNRHNTISNNNANNNTWYGIQISGCSPYNTLSGNVMSGNRYNFELLAPYEDHVIDLSNLADGKPIYYVRGASNTVYNSSTNAATIYLIDSVNVTVRGLTLTNNGFGVCLWNTTSSRIENVTAANNAYGIFLGKSSGNTIYHNDFIDNTYAQAYFADLSPPINKWDDDYPSGGNYWSDYTGVDFYSGPYQNITGSDGIGDTPYPIAANNQDKYPLMEPWTPPPPPPKPVGGVWVPVDKFALLAPYIALASTILVATAATAIYVKRVKRRKKKQ